MKIRDDLTKSELIELYNLSREVKLIEARESLYEYCRLVDADFYTTEKWHLKLICDTLQALYEGNLTDATGKVYRKLIIALPPRFGKSRTLIHFAAWVLGLNCMNKIMLISYEDGLANDFSKYTRNEIMQSKYDMFDIIYSDIFDTKIRKGSGSVEQWAVEGTIDGKFMQSFFSYLGSGVMAGITGKGCNILISDDLVKGPNEAENPLTLEKIYDSYRNTALSRKEKDSIEIMCATRWNDKDPSGMILNNENLSKNFYTLILPAIDKNGNLLCESILPLHELEEKKAVMSNFIYSANYLQVPLTQSNPLYVFRTYQYTDLPNISKDEKIGFLDIARKGKDYLSLPIAVNRDNYIYLIDWYHSQENTDVTIPELCQFITDNKLTKIKYESNNGGDDFIQILERKLRYDYRYYDCWFTGFHQSINKEAKISLGSHRINTSVLFPIDYERRFASPVEQMKNYKKGISGQPDDAPDSLTELTNYILDEGAIDYYSNYDKKMK